MGNPNPFQGDTAAGKSNPRSRRWLINVPKHAGHNQDIVELLIIKQVGNYGEAFDRNVGAGSALGIARGLNALWSKGGLQYAPPVR